MIARARIVAVLAFLGAGALSLISSTQTWILVTLSDGAQEQLAVSGGAALPLLAPLSLTTLALGGALSIAGPVLRYVFGALGAAVGAGLVWLTVPAVFAPPLSTVSAAISTATGIGGEDAVSALVAGLTTTPWPSLTLAAAVLLSAAAVGVLATARSWSDSGRRYRSRGDVRTAPSGPLDPIDSWDDLSHGEDPTARPLD